MKLNVLRRLGALLLTLALALPMAVPAAWAADRVPAESINIDGPSELSLNVGDAGYLYASILPLDTTDPVTWRCGDATVVRVNGNGNSAYYAAVGAGTTTITATCGGQSASVRVTVRDPYVFNVKMVPEAVTLFPGQISTISLDIESDLGTTVKWSGGSKTTVEITPSADGLSCRLEAKSKGNSSARITAVVSREYQKDGKTVRDSKTVTCTATVVDPTISVTGLTIPKTASVAMDSSIELTATITPASAKNTPVYWSSENPSVAMVDSKGKVTGMATGSTVITAVCGDKEATCTVTVTGKVTDVYFNKTTGVLGAGEEMYTQFNSDDPRSRTVSVTAAAEGGAAPNSYVVWSSTDTALVTVAPKSVTTSADITISSNRAAGEADITATLYDNSTKKPILRSDGKTPYSARLKVIISGLTLSDSELTMYEGESRTLSVANRYGEVTEDTVLEWRSTDSSVVAAEPGGGIATLNAWNRGAETVTVTTRNGKYSAACKVTVTEDPGTVVKAGSASAGNAVKLGTSSVISQINSIARQRTGSTMDYISSIFISPDQGVVYNTYTSEPDTGSGVSMAEKYYVNRSTPATEYIGALSFVPNKTYNGEARISYIGRAAGQSISGIISVNVSGLGQGNTDVTYTANAAPVTFVASDFNVVCANKTGRSLKYVTFTPPQASAGTLYENYINKDHPGQKVVASTQYSRTSSPNIGSVTFVPAEGYSGTVTISYRAVDSANAPYTGRVTINVTKSDSRSDPADIFYTTPLDGWATFRAADFATACQRTIGETLSHVRFALPSGSDGTLFYNYRGFGDYDSDVASTTSYYQSGSPALSGVAFVPATTSSGRTAIYYTGYSTRGTTFTGTVYVTEGNYSAGGSGGSTAIYDYTVDSGAFINLSAYNFNADCQAKTGENLDYLQFTALPSASQGTLRYTAGASTGYANATASTRFHRTGSGNSVALIGNINFLASSSFTGVVRIPYTGWDVKGTSYSSEITIQVTPNNTVYVGTTASPLQMSAARMRNAVSSAFSGDLDYIEFTSLPSAANQGRMYLSYSGYGTGTPVTTGVRYNASTVPNIDQISFVGKARYTGDAVASYTAYSTTGEKMSGHVTFRITAATGCTNFNDMGGHTWAAASVDYLYQNHITNGMTATSYGPTYNIRRCDFVLMLQRIFQFSGGSAANTGFSDVPANAYYAQAVSSAKRLGIVSGDGGNFRPSAQVTRQDAMVMVYNTMRATGKISPVTDTSNLNSFPDASSVPAYARPAVSALVRMGAVSGDNGYLNPNNSITRAEASIILHFVMTA